MATMLFAVLMIGGVAYAAVIKCDREGDLEPAPGACLGTDQSDNITGTGKGDFIDGAGGNDTINARAGFDEVEGSGGEDTIHGGPRTDRLRGGFGSDVMFGEGGDDIMAEEFLGQAGSGNNQYFGGRGDDQIDAGSSFEGEVETVSGGPGDDFIFSDDLFNVRDNVDCGRGFDSVNADSADVVNLDNCEDVF
jgi:serralysin